jgi:hypothetical protein
MSITTNLTIHATICVVAGIVLLVKPELVLNTPLDPYVVKWTRLPTTVIDRTVRAVVAIPIIAIGFINAMIVYTGDINMVRVSCTLLLVRADGKFWADCSSALPIYR